MKFDEKTFFNEIKKLGLFKKLTQSQVENFQLIKNEFVAAGHSNPNQLAYIFATAYHETGATMAPIEERGKGKGKPYGEMFDYGEGPGKRVAYTSPNKIYYGIGHVQLTWRCNYKNMGKVLGLPLLEQPELMLDPKISAKVLIEGMMKGSSNFGDFTGVSLEQFVNDTKVDFVNARKVINLLDKADLIAGYAKTFKQAII